VDDDITLLFKDITHDVVESFPSGTVSASDDLIDFFVSNNNGFRAWKILSEFPTARTNLSKLSNLCDDLTAIADLENLFAANPNKLDKWIEFDDFFVTRTDDYWNQFNNPPTNLEEARIWSVEALKRLPDEYTDAIANFAHIDGNSDVFTRYGVDYKQAYHEIIDNYIATNPHNFTALNSHCIFGYTSNFFYRKLNSFLWQEINPSETIAITGLLNSSLQKLPVFGNQTIYRGIAIDPLEIDDFLLQHTINEDKIWKGFSSCGSSKTASFSENPEVNVIFKITHIDAKDISDLADGIHFRDKPPHELLLKNGSTMRVQNEPYLDPDFPDQEKYIIEVLQIN
jgi:hypothetical protein